MSTLITTCIMCLRRHEEGIEATKTTCPYCGHWYWLDDDDRDNRDEADYGGASDGHPVHSDADPGL